MSTIDRDDLKHVGYAEFGEWLDLLEANVRRAGKRFDAVAPILRSGAIPGAHLAQRLGIVPIVPLQYKYTPSGCEAVLEPALPKRDLPSGNPAILLVDTNTVTGGTAVRAARDLRVALCEPHITLASVVVDLSLEKLDGIDAVVWALRSNEARHCSASDARSQGVAPTVFVFPWEDIEEQWREIALSGDA